MVPPTVCSTSHASFNLTKKPRRHAQKLISLVALDLRRSLPTEPPASRLFLISTGSLHSLAHPPALWFQQYDTFHYLFPSLWRQDALSCFNPLTSLLALQRHIRPSKRHCNLHSLRALIWLSINHRKFIFATCRGLVSTEGSDESDWAVGLCEK